jgi:hypothetical protein
MKDFMKKMMYLILLVVSFSTLFSAILYADPIYCNYDYECPQGMICVIPGNFCMVPATITCTDEPLMVGEISYCYVPEYYHGGGITIVLCKWTGVQTVKYSPKTGQMQK